ncbi:MAG TPA: sulfatase [Blastocatellia bacterium]|nr:sulfatase [Blastocatellia bacterium]
MVQGPATLNPEHLQKRKASRHGTPARIASSLARYSLAGSLAALLLAVIEIIDLQVHLSPEFNSFRERLIFAAYFSLCPVSGAAIGLIIGVVALAGSVLQTFTRKLLTGRIGTERRVEVAAAAVAAAVIVAVFIVQTQSKAYVSGLIIEAQKLPYLYGRLLKHQAILIVAILLGLLVACRIFWRLARAVRQMSPAIKALWFMGLCVVIGLAYYVDSHVEVQLYEYTLHRSMFLLCFGSAITLIGSGYFTRANERAFSGRLSRGLLVLFVALILAGSVFTFAEFGSNQNLKTHLMTRTTQAKQHFKIVQWVLDFDRDGYSSVLAGGDTDDRNPAINPDRAEIIGDGIDNNSIGGDLSEEQRTEWFRERTSLHAPDGPVRERLNVIYIFIDALRADHLSVYGYGRNTSPEIDRFALRSIVFDNAFSPSANTFESAARFMKSSYWDATVESWTEVLGHNGYNVMLFPQRRYPMLKRYVKGAHVDSNAKGVDLPESIDIAIETLSNVPKEAPFCAFIYAVDPHRPYARHSDFNFGSGNTDLYDGEIAFTDHYFGRLFEWLEKSGHLNDTAVVLMADHAESLGERRVYRHSSQLYSDQTHIPMIFYVPGLASRRVQDYVTSVDLGTTILNVVGAPCPEQYTGVSLLALMKGEPFVHPPIFGEQTLREKEFPNLRPEQYPQPTDKKFMIITQDGYKLIYDRAAAAFQLFDLKNDGAELHNLYDQRPEVSLDLKQKLGRFIDIVSASRPALADEAKYKFEY